MANKAVCCSKWYFLALLHSREPENKQNIINGWQQLENFCEENAIRVQFFKTIDAMMVSKRMNICDRQLLQYRCRNRQTRLYSHLQFVCQ